MKLINKAILIASASFCLSLSAFAQDMSLTAKDITVKEAMEQLKSSSGYSFVFSSSDVNTKKRISISAKNETLENIVKQILQGQPELDYEIQGKKIIIRKRTSQKPAQTPETHKLSGTITDTNGEPIIGASVQVKGTTNGTISDYDGNFMLNAPTIPRLKYLLSASRLFS